MVQADTLAGNQTYLPSNSGFASVELHDLGKVARLFETCWVTCKVAPTIGFRVVGIKCANAQCLACRECSLNVCVVAFP